MLVSFFFAYTKSDHARRMALKKSDNASAWRMHDTVRICFITVPFSS